MKPQKPPSSIPGPRWRLVLLAVVVVLLLAGGALRWMWQGNRGASAPPGSARPENVLLITLDTVRADRLGAYGHPAARTPNLDALARNGVRFDDATTVGPITGPAHAAILTGLQPARFGVRDNAITPLPAEASTLAEMLSPRGFATGGFIGAFILDRPYGFAQGFETFDSGFTRVDSGREANAERPGNAVVDDAIKWLAGIPADRPFFGWVHLYDAHAGYLPPPPFAPTYDGELAFVDQQVGRLVEALRARGAIDRTLIVAVGDHGESLGQHGEAEHGAFVYDAVLRVPFIAAGPGIKAAHAVTEQVRVVDLAPTILEALDLPIPDKLDGESLLSLLRGGKRERIPPSYAESYYPKLHYGWSELRAIRADGWKAIDAPTPELYNLREDPRELNNRYASRRPLADKLIAEATRIERELTGGAVAAAKQPDRETLERLRSLGYVGSSAPLPAGVRGPDPKDRIARQREYNRLMSEAIDDLRAQQPEAAITKFKRLVGMNDKAYDLHQFLGEAYERLGRPEQALGEYAYAAILNPVSVIPLVSAAEVHLKRGNLANARTQLADALKVQEDSYDVQALSGRILEREGRLPEALEAYERAVAINGANPRARAQIAAIATRIKRWDVAERHLQKLLEIGYQPSRTHIGLGQVAQLQGRNAEAAANYREALRLEPGLPMAIEGLKSLGIR
ncbi:MAG TPA: sulfatase-like hydrolase/transferase [Vicinamibacterales bacterium]|nr:sulfatase-like hydrolase/transferase [Vicinamibacterales bacterium]